VRSVLVVVTRQIGDVLLTTPLIRAARKLWPQARIDVLGLQGTLGMLDGNPDVHAIIPMPARAGPLAVARLAARLWRRYDLALVADPGDRAHLVGWVAARERSGLVAPGESSQWWKRRWLRHAVPLAGDLGAVHVVQERMALLEPWQGAAVRPEIVAPAAQSLPEVLQRRLAPGYLVVHTPSMWRYKQWPPEHFRELIGLLALAGRQVVLTGGPGAADRATVAAMEGAAPAPQLVDAGVLDFNQVAQLLRGAALYIGPDTSITHLAAACGTPVLAIFGPTNPQRWAPWPADAAQPVHFQRRAAAQTVGGVTLMQAGLACVPCGKAGCEDHRDSRADCLLAITPERVAAQALELLARGRSVAGPATSGPPDRAE
jgi:heptosyltransferase-3